MFREKKKTDHPSVTGCQQSSADLVQELTTAASVSALSVSHPEDSIPHLTPSAFRLLHSLFLPQCSPSLGGVG